jgi:hypothetical protein
VMANPSAIEDLSGTRAIKIGLVRRRSFRN